MRKFALPSALGILLVLVSCANPTRDPRSPGELQPGTHARMPGKQADGSTLLHNEWSLLPAGRQVEMGDLPVNIAVHPSGRFAAVLHCGYGAHEVVVVDIPAGSIVCRTNIREAFYGIAFGPDGGTLYCSGAGDEVIHEFSFKAGLLEDHRSIKLRDPKERAVPAGIAIAPGGDRLLAANVWGHRVTSVELGREPKAFDIPLGTNTAPLRPAPVLPSKDFDLAAADKRAEAALYPSAPSDTFPYGCLVDAKRNRLFVSLWAQAAVAVIDLASGQVISLWQTEDHPCEMALTRDGKRLFVANANRNTVSVLDAANGKTTETIWAALYPKSPPGSTPNSLALSPDETTLFVANADNNAVAVFDVSKPGKSRSLGFIPAGWYPTSVRVTPDGKSLLIANGRGTQPKSNPQGPQPRRDSSNRTVEYIGGLYRGTLSILPLPKRRLFEQQLVEFTAQVYRCSPLRADASVTASRSPNNPVPQKPGDATPIRYCIYIIKENRTYDQVLGDMPQGNGDPKLCLFPEKITPNHHAIAREFGLLDNFYVNSEVSADGHEWSMGAYATDFVKRMWPLSYGHNRTGKHPYPSEGNFPIASPSKGYLWDKAREAGISYYSFGEFVANGKNHGDPGRAKVKSLEGHFDPLFRSFDMTYPDRKRAERYISELKRFETQGEMPRLQIIRLPSDHTHGTGAGVLTPTALVADNDAALGMVVEAITHSKFWPQTAILVLEDDAQNGPDHVDAHRAPAFVISPYSRRGSVDSTMYASTSLLRTIELILGLQPMSQYDAAATPMYSAFQPVPDLRAYTALPANVDLNERNPATAWGSDLKMNFAEEDAADDLLLNEVVWRSVKGNRSPMPAPVRAGFVFSGSSGDGDDDD